MRSRPEGEAISTHRKMPKKLNILFICTGNTFRSASAEYCLKDFLKKKGIKNIGVSSAGTIAAYGHVAPETEKDLEKFGVSAAGHKRRKLTRKILDEQDVVVAISPDHREFIKEKFGVYVPVWNELALGQATPILDVNEIKAFPSDQKGMDRHVSAVVNHIHKYTPKLFERIKRTNLIFADFVAGRVRDHGDGLPFIPLHKTKHSIAFMSVNIPSTEDGHIIVIPKKRYSRLEDIPKVVRQDLMEAVATIGRAVMKTHEGYNVLLNNGHSAGQYIFHTHFHVIPRRHDDKIRIEVWKDKKMTKKEFLKLNEAFRKNIRAVAGKKGK
jgi:protein-tyrosine phosphatase